MKRIQFSLPTVIAVYAILAAGLLGIGWIWWQMPKDAVEIDLYDDHDGHVIKSFTVAGDQTTNRVTALGRTRSLTTTSSWRPPSASGLT